MQQFDDHHEYPASAEQVLERLTDPEFLREKYTALGREDIEFLAAEKDEAQSRMRIRYSDKPDMDVPGFAKKFVPERALVEQEVNWDLAARTGTVVIESKGSPVTVRGRMALQDSAEGCRNNLHWEISCSVPLVGGKLEKLLVGGLKTKGRRDEEVTRQMLAG